MKKTLIPALIGLLACTLSASAISIIINEDSAVRLDFTVLWDSTQPAADTSDMVVGSLNTISAIDAGILHFSSVLVDIINNALGGVQGPVFNVDFLSSADRSLVSSTLSGGNDVPDFVHSLVGNDYGARFIYGEDISTGVPDGGSTLMLLAGALGTLGCFQRRFRRASPHVI